jgi:hypothetical protein
MESSSWQGNDIWGMIRTLAVCCTAIHDCSKDDSETLAETSSDEMVIRAVWALYEISRLVSQQNHSNLSLTALNNALKSFYKKKGALQDQKISKSANANVNEQLARV